MNVKAVTSQELKNSMRFMDRKFIDILIFEP